MHYFRRLSKFYFMIKNLLNKLPAAVVPSQIGARTHTGLVRPHNEDAYLYSALPGDDATVVVMSDGMGGHDGGELASHYISEIIFKYWMNRSYSSSKINDKMIENLLVDSIREANSILDSVNKKLQISRAMGTTTTVGLFIPGKLIVAHVGDSRCYRLRKGKLKQLTEDQTWVAKMVKMGSLKKSEAINHPLEHLLSNCVGATPNIQISVTKHKRKLNDKYLFSTDGMHGLVSFSEIQRILNVYDSPERSSKELIYHSLKKGGIDNTTCVVVHDNRTV